MIVFFIAVILFFLSFYLVGRVAAESVNKRRLAEIQAAVQKVPAGLGSLGEKLAPPTTQLRLRRRLLEAGRPRDLDVDGFMSLKAIGAVGGLALAVLVGTAARFGPGRIAALALIFTAAGFFAPEAWLARQIEARRQRISRSLPDVLDMLTISVEAGLGFDAAVTKVVKNFNGPLAAEFRRWLQEVQLGRSRKEAWRDLATRTNVPEVNSFVLAILQADTFGISIGNVLRVQADEMRVRRRQRAEEAAMKTPVKVVFPLVLCIFPALMIVILGPAAIKISESLWF